ncbi:MAG: EthD domain-containing protein [Candidatus Lambdaproteobacteria bacterium]|nr:EthD domain-containing protein [Candidatus Lambdaproteobacteria bacterium]
MIKLTFCIRRLPQLSREEFFSYWHGHHAALARKNAKAMRVARYVQLHALEDRINDVLRGSRKAPQGFDGVAEMWWPSREEMNKAFSTPEGKAAGKEMLADEKNFIDLANSPIWLSEEHEMPID